VGLRAVVDVVVKRKIPSPRRESKPRTPIIIVNACAPKMGRKCFVIKA